MRGFVTGSGTFAWSCETCVSGIIQKAEGLKQKRTLLKKAGFLISIHWCCKDRPSPGKSPHQYRDRRGDRSFPALQDAIEGAAGRFCDQDLSAPAVGVEGVRQAIPGHGTQAS